VIDFKCSEHYQAISLQVTLVVYYYAMPCNALFYEYDT